MSAPRKDTTIPVNRETHQDVEDALLEEQVEQGKRISYDEFVKILLRRSKKWKKLQRK